MSNTTRMPEGAELKKPRKLSPYSQDVESFTNPAKGSKSQIDRMPLGRKIKRTIKI